MLFLVSVGPAQPYALARNKSEGAIQYHLSANRQQQQQQQQNFGLPSTYQNTEGSRPYPNGVSGGAGGAQAQGTNSSNDQASM